jgi:tRNA A37 threonylcarbamoyladenosine dehydratase
VIGVGGVGSWAVEALVRSAIGTITMIDLDVVAPSNVNRQLPALESNFGRDKTAVLAQRCADINPDCQVHIVDDFITIDNLDDLLPNGLDYVIDGIDDFRTKAALIAHCRRNRINLVTTGGAGGQVDPGKIRRSDLSRTQHDVLLAKTRKLLRQSYSFPRNPKRSFGVPCIYSDEQLVYPDGSGGLSPSRPVRDASQGEASNALNCAGGLGSVTHVTASFGFAAVAVVLNDLAKNVAQ